MRIEGKNSKGFSVSCPLSPLHLLKPPVLYLLCIQAENGEELSEESTGQHCRVHHIAAADNDKSIIRCETIVPSICPLVFCHLFSPEYDKVKVNFIVPNGKKNSRATTIIFILPLFFSIHELVIKNVK